MQTEEDIGQPRKTQKILVLQLLNDDSRIKNCDFDCELIILYIWFAGAKQELFFYFLSLFLFHCYFINAWKEVCVCLGSILVFFLSLILKLFACMSKNKVLLWYMCV